MYIYKALFRKELVCGLRDQRADAERALEQVGARAQVRDGAQVFQRVALLLERIVAAACAHDLYCGRVQLERLGHVGRYYQRAGRLDGCAHAGLYQLLVVGKRVLAHYDLQVLKERAVVYLHKGEGLGLAQRAYPAGYGNVFYIARGLLREQLLYSGHEISSGIMAFTLL